MHWKGPVWWSVERNFPIGRGGGEDFLHTRRTFLETWNWHLLYGYAQEWEHSTLYRLGCDGNQRLHTAVARDRLLRAGFIVWLFTKSHIHFGRYVFSDDLDRIRHHPLAYGDIWYTGKARYRASRYKVQEHFDEKSKHLLHCWLWLGSDTPADWLTRHCIQLSSWHETLYGSRGARWLLQRE